MDDPGEYSDDFVSSSDEEYSDKFDDDFQNGDAQKKPMSAAEPKENKEDEEPEDEYDDDFEEDSEEEVSYCNK